jgi:hypothetical protein
MATTVQPTRTTNARRTTLRSIGAVAGAFVAMAIITAIVDQIFHSLGVFPPWGQAYYATGPYVLAVLYRAIFGVGGAYLAAQLAPRAPMRHAIALGIVGVVLSLASVASPATRSLDPVWYPVVLAIISLPSAWLGGRLHARLARRR